MSLGLVLYYKVKIKCVGGGQQRKPLVSYAQPTHLPSFPETGGVTGSGWGTEREMHRHG